MFVGKQILIIDDQSQLLSLMRRILEDEQYQVSILVLKQLKMDAVTAEIPVIVYTAAVLEAEEVARTFVSDPKLYQRVYLIQKPFELDELLTLVEQVVNEPVH